MNLKKLAVWYVALLGVSGIVGLKYGGIYWLPFDILLFPPALVIAGYVYGRLTGAGGEVNSLDDAVSAGLKYRDGYDPEEEYGDE